MIYLIGAGGHAAVIEDMAKKNNYSLAGVFYDGDINNLTKLEKIGNFVDLENFVDKGSFVLAFGDIENRIMIANRLGKDAKWQTIVDPTAIIAGDVLIGEGTVVMPGAIINAGARIGSHVIINSGAVVEHGCVINDHVHVAPGSVICGNCVIGKGSFIGARTVVINAINIGENVVIGAGSAVINDLESDLRVVGVPAKKTLKKK